MTHKEIDLLISDSDLFDLLVYCKCLKAEIDSSTSDTRFLKSDLLQTKREICSYLKSHIVSI